MPVRKIPVQNGRAQNAGMEITSKSGGDGN